MRPCKSYPGNPLNYRGNKITNPSGADVPIDQVVFRENTEGMYGGVEFFPLPEPVYTALCANPKMQQWKERSQASRTLRCPLRHHERARPAPTFHRSVRVRQKPVTQARDADREAERVARDRRPDDALLSATWPRITRRMRGGRREHRRHVHVDVQERAGLLRCWWRENMFGDIVSDLCAGFVGGLGFAPSANLGDDYAVFEPTHGSAPKYAGQYKVNPIAMLLTVKLMFDWLKEDEMAARLESAIARVIAEGKVRTYDLGGKASTLDVAKAIGDYAG